MESRCGTRPARVHEHRDEPGHVDDQAAEPRAEHQLVRHVEERAATGVQAASYTHSTHGEQRTASGESLSWQSRDFRQVRRV